VQNYKNRGRRIQEGQAEITFHNATYTNVYSMCVLQHVAQHWYSNAHCTWEWIDQFKWTLQLVTN